MIEKLLRAILGKFRINVSRQSSPHDVQTLIARLKPVESGVALIRIGPDADGGYLIPNDLAGINYCFSPGVSLISDFESELADLGINSFLADFSVEAPPIIRPEFIFDKKFVGSLNSGNFMTLQYWKDKYLADYDGDLLLQMDIEGYEYQVFLETPVDLLKQFRIIVVEFHMMDRVFDVFGLQMISAVFDKLLEHFYVVHVHPNNYSPAVKIHGIAVPRYLEITLYNKNRVEKTYPITILPHKLDHQNVPDKPAVNLDTHWYLAG